MQDFCYSCVCSISSIGKSFDLFVKKTIGCDSFLQSFAYFCHRKKQSAINSFVPMGQMYKNLIRRMSTVKHCGIFIEVLF